MAIDIIMYEIKDICLWISLFIRIRPYLPSFSRIAARIIDPATGASTWALGSHMCRENRGILTMNVIINIVHLICGSIVVGSM